MWSALYQSPLRLPLASSKTGEGCMGGPVPENALVRTQETQSRCPSLSLTQVGGAEQQEA